MTFDGKIVAITGAGRGIGKAFAEALAAQGARVAACDLDGAAAAEVGEACNGFGMRVDVSDESQVCRFLMEVERRLGPVDMYFSNAGVGAGDGPQWGAGTAPNDAWALNWNVNVMASVYAARHVIPGMVKRGSGVFVITASAAGFLSQIGDAAYTATKHAAAAFAESISICHGDDGVQAHVVAPEGVRTRMVEGIENGVQGMSGYLEPEDVARATLDAIREKRFRVFTHENTAQFAQMRVAEPDRWLGGMRKIRRGLIEKFGRPL